jgi:hypothetical protein
VPFGITRGDEAHGLAFEGRDQWLPIYCDVCRIHFHFLSLVLWLPPELFLEDAEAYPEISKIGRDRLRLPAILRFNPTVAHDPYGALSLFCARIFLTGLSLEGKMGTW